MLKAGLERELAGVAGVVEVRGQGLMIGIELDRPCAPLLGRAAEAGLMISVTAERVVRLLPALILHRDEAAQIVAILCPLIKEFLASRTAHEARHEPQASTTCSSGTSAPRNTPTCSSARRSSRSASRTTRSTRRWSTARWR